MKTLRDIRHHNLLLLLDECGTGRGAAAKLSTQTGVPAPYISQLKSEKKHSGGADRTMGDDIARKLEAGMDKPSGWMDQDHGLAKRSQEASLLDLFRALTPLQRDKLFGMAEEFADLNAAAIRVGRPEQNDPNIGRSSRKH